MGSDSTDINMGDLAVNGDPVDLDQVLLSLEYARAYLFPLSSVRVLPTTTWEI